MSLFKKFTDFCGGIAAFMGGLFIIQKYMAFKPKTDEEYIDWIATDTDLSSEYIESITEAPGKISQFMTPGLTQNNDYRPIVILTLLIVFSLIIARVFQRLPQLCLAVSILPVIVATYMFCKGTLYNQASLFIMLTVIPVLGNAVDCVLRDKEDGRHRLWLGAKLSIAVPSIFCLILAVCAKVFPSLPEEFFTKNLSVFDELRNLPEELFDVFVISGVLFLIVLVISTVLLNVYFIDMILSLIPLAYIAYQLYNVQFSALIPVLLILAIICFITNLMLCTLENNLSKEEQEALATTQRKNAKTQSTAKKTLKNKKNKKAFSKKH